MTNEELFVKPKDVENLTSYLPGVYEGVDELAGKIAEVLINIVREREQLEEDLRNRG